MLRTRYKLAKGDIYFLQVFSAYMVHTNYLCLKGMGVKSNKGFIKLTPLQFNISVKPFKSYASMSLAEKCALTEQYN